VSAPSLARAIRAVHGVDALETPYKRLVARHLLEAVYAVAVEHGVTLADILGRGRTKAVARARHVTWWTFRERGFSYPEIGWFFDVDHSTVMSACRKFAPKKRVAA